MKIDKIQRWKLGTGCYGKIHIYLRDKNKTACGIKTLPQDKWFDISYFFANDNNEITCKNCLKKLT